jgi:dolichyl-phosphate-mannose-protein mannosyltransferase
MCLGQLFNVYCGTIAVILGFAMGVLGALGRRWVSKELVWTWLKILPYPAGYCMSLFPFARLTRQMFFYHYIIPNVFAMLTFVQLVDLTGLSARIRTCLLTYAQVGTALAFYFWQPWTYGGPLEDFHVRLWNHKWA